MNKKEKRDVAINDLLASLYVLNDLNIDCFTKEESEEYGWRVIGASINMIRSFDKSFSDSSYLPEDVSEKPKPSQVN